MISRPRVFVSRTIDAEAIEVLRRECRVDVWPGELPPSREELLRRVARCEGVVTLLSERVDDAFLDAAGSQLKVVSNYAVGFDNIDTSACLRRGVAVGNTPGVLTETTADFAWALLMSSARRVAEGDRYVRVGKWKAWGPQLLLGTDVHGSTLGIVGFGRIGQAVARRARGFDMRVLYHTAAPYPSALANVDAEFVTLEVLLRESDFVSLHVNLTESTTHLIDERALKLMKSTAILINTARGPVVDHTALAKALRNGWIAGAALDVTDPEPIPPSHPLLDLENCAVVPHMASASRETRKEMAFMAAANLLAGVFDKPLPNPVPTRTD